MFAKSLQWRDGDDLAVDVDDEHAGGGWSPPEVIPAAFPPSDLLRRQPSDSLFRGFVFLRRLLSRKPWGGLYIVVFRSRRSFGKKDRRQRRPEGHFGGSHAVRESGRVGPPFSAFWSPFLRFLCAYVSFLPKKVIPVKSQVIMT